MFEQLMGMAQEHLGGNMGSHPDLQQAGVNPQDVAGVASESIMQGLNQQVQSGDYSSVQEMLSGMDTSPDSPAVNGLMPGVTSQLSNRLGLSPGVAQTIAMMAIPLILNMLNGRVNQSRQGGNDIGGMLGGLLGGGNAGNSGNANSGGGIGGLLGSVLGGGGNAAPQRSTGGSAQDLLGGIFGSLLK